MAIILPSSLFIHVPKTGGTWITQALKNCGIGEQTGKKPVCGHSTKHASYRELAPHYENAQNKKIWLFVRNPVYWWQSFWSCPYNRNFFKLKKNPVNTNWCGSIRWLNFEVQKQTQEHFDNFNSYIGSVLERRPGFFTEYFNLLLISPTQKKVGKYENIVNDTARILKEYGEIFNEKKLRSTPPTNESDPTLKTIRLYTKKNLGNIIDAEKKLMEEYGYSTNIDDYKHALIK